MRFSVKSLLALTFLIAATVGGLLYANILWAAGFVTATFLFVLYSIVAAIVRTGAARPFWIGAAVFGASYFAFAIMFDNVQLPDPNTGVWREPKLLTSELLLWSDSLINQWRNPPQRAPISFAPYAARAIPGSNRPYATRGQIGHFLLVGHSIFTLVFALVGGALGKSLNRREQNAIARANPVPSWNACPNGL